MYNQRDYPHIKYPAKGYEGATVSTSGCGPVCMSIVVENMTSKAFPPEISVPYAIKAGARVSGGTDMRLLASCIARDFELRCLTSNSMDELRQVLQRGGMAIANVAGGNKGIFSDGGHYVVCVGLSGADVIVADPYTYKGKFDKPWRRIVRMEGDLIYCPLKALHTDTEGRTPRYYLFE